MQRRRTRVANAREQICAFDHKCAHLKEAKSSPRASVALGWYKSTSKKSMRGSSAMSEPQKIFLCNKLKMRGRAPLFQLQTVVKVLTTCPS